MTPEFARIFLYSSRLALNSGPEPRTTTRNDLLIGLPKGVVVGLTYGV